MEDQQFLVKLYKHSVNVKLAINKVLQEPGSSLTEYKLLKLKLLDNQFDGVIQYIEAIIKNGKENNTQS